MDNFAAKAPLAGDVLTQAPGVSAEALPQDGTAIRRMQDSRGFATAIAVQKKRNLVDVEERVLQESRLLGEHAYYGWSAGGDKIEGPSVKLATMVARNWGNCAVDALPVQNIEDAWIFTAAFIDLETGFTLTRQFRQAKKSTVHGRLDAERKDDIRFQIGQSKAVRNVILNALPAGMIDNAVEVAKQGVKERIESLIESNGLEAVRRVCIKELAKHGVTEARILAKMGRSAVAGLVLDDLVTLKGNLVALNDGAEHADALFPPPEGEKSSTDDLREELTRKPEEPAQTPDGNGEPDNSKLEEVMDRKAAKVDPAVRRKGIRDLWDGIPEGDRASALKNLTLKGKVKKLTRIEDIEMVDDDGDLSAIRDSFMDARRDV